MAIDELKITLSKSDPVGNPQTLRHLSSLYVISQNGGIRHLTLACTTWRDGTLHTNKM